MFWYLRLGSDTLEDAVRFGTKRAAVASYTRTARELDRYGQSIEATLHYASSRGDLAEYPDFVLSLGPRGGIRCKRC